VRAYREVSSGGSFITRKGEIQDPDTAIFPGVKLYSGRGGRGSQFDTFDTIKKEGTLVPFLIQKSSIFLRKILLFSEGLFPRKSPSQITQIGFFTPGVKKRG
jgi:hypothetical protein